jgi:hypothetical protein
MYWKRLSRKYLTSFDLDEKCQFIPRFQSTIHGLNLNNFNIPQIFILISEFSCFENIIFQLFLITFINNSENFLINFDNIFFFSFFINSNFHFLFTEFCKFLLIFDIEHFGNLILNYNFIYFLIEGKLLQF